MTVIATLHPNDPDRNSFGCEVRSDGGYVTTSLATITVAGGKYETDDLSVINSSGDTVSLVAGTAAYFSADAFLQ